MLGKIKPDFQQNLFKTRLTDLINPLHPTVMLAQEINWVSLEEKFENLPCHSLPEELQYKILPCHSLTEEVQYEILPCHPLTEEVQYEFLPCHSLTEEWQSEILPCHSLTEEVQCEFLPCHSLKNLLLFLKQKNIIVNAKNARELCLSAQNG